MRKKLLSALLISSMSILLITGCNKNTNTTNPETNSEVTTTAIVPLENQTIEYEDNVSHTWGNITIDCPKNLEFIEGYEADPEDTNIFTIKENEVKYIDFTNYGSDKNALMANYELAYGIDNNKDNTITKEINEKVGDNTIIGIETSLGLELYCTLNDNNNVRITALNYSFDDDIVKDILSSMAVK